MVVGLARGGQKSMIKLSPTKTERQPSEALHAGAGAASPRTAEELAAQRIQRCWRRYHGKPPDGDGGNPFSEREISGGSEAVLQSVENESETLRQQLDHANRPDAWGFALDDNNVLLLQRLFYAMNSRGGETLNIAELQELWKVLFNGLSDHEVQRITEHIWTDIAENDSEEIHWDEFFTYLRGVAQDGSEIDAMLGVEGLLERPGSRREWIWAVVDQAQGTKYELPMVRNLSLGFQLSVQLIIILSIVIMVVESLPEVDSGGPLFVIESVCIGIFSVEFLLRTCSTPRPRTYWAEAFTWIDLLAILPYYLTVAGLTGEDSSSNSLVILRVLRMARLVRVLRVLKLGRNSEGIQLMALALQRSRIALTWALALVLMAVVLFASLMFYVEKEDATFVENYTRPSDGFVYAAWVRPLTSRYWGAGQPIFFQSIPDAMWWALLTLTTVGYGDVYPVTPMGKAVGSISMITGLLVIAYPVTIISTAFTELQTEFAEKRKSQRRRERFKAKLAQSAKRKSMGESRPSNTAQSAREGCSSNASPEDGEATGDPLVALSSSDRGAHGSSSQGRLQSPRGKGPKGFRKQGSDASDANSEPMGTPQRCALGGGAQPISPLDIVPLQLVPDSVAERIAALTASVHDFALAAAAVENALRTHCAAAPSPPLPTPPTTTPAAPLTPPPQGNSVTAALADPPRRSPECNNGSPATGLAHGDPQARHHSTSSEDVGGSSAQPSDDTAGGRTRRRRRPQDSASPPCA